ncbi:MAG TPA: hypothetical protein EYG73_13775 [Arcobacter sp.]|nr:hypothetical protein [Arcobacter sp.]
MKLLKKTILLILLISTALSANKSLNLKGDIFSSQGILTYNIPITLPIGSGEFTPLLDIMHQQTISDASTLGIYQSYPI